MYADSIAIINRSVRSQQGASNVVLHYTPDSTPSTMHRAYPASSLALFSVQRTGDMSNDDVLRKKSENRVIAPNASYQHVVIHGEQTNLELDANNRPFRKSARVLKAWRSSNAILPNGASSPGRPKSLKFLTKKQLSISDSSYIMDRTGRTSAFSTASDTANGDNRCNENNNSRSIVEKDLSLANKASWGGNFNSSSTSTKVKGAVRRLSASKSQIHPTCSNNLHHDSKIGAKNTFKPTVITKTDVQHIYIRSNYDDQPKRDFDKKSPTPSTSTMASISDTDLANKYNLDDKTMKLYKQSFRIFDRNGDGCITSEELGTVMQFLGYAPSTEELSSMVHEADEDGNGTIEFSEFVNLMRRHLEKKEKQNQNSIDDLSDAFYVFDRDKDGYITAKELREVMKSLGEELTDTELNAMIKAADADGDGRINFEGEENFILIEITHGNNGTKTGCVKSLSYTNLKKNISNYGNLPTSSSVDTINDRPTIIPKQRSLRSNESSPAPTTSHESRGGRFGNKHHRQALSKKSVERFAKSLKIDSKTLEHYYEAFRLFDKNRDGSITTGELRTVMHSLGIYVSDNDLRALIDGFDENENGTIEFEEFIRLMLLHVSDKNETEDLRHAFNVFDKDRDGFISSIELSAVMKSLGETMNEKEIKSLIREADKDGDGRVNFEEFQAMLKEPKSGSNK